MFISATMLLFTSYEIAINPGIQQKIYEEIILTNIQLGGKRTTNDVLQKMKYLDQAICEVLCKWQPGFVNDRVCTKDYAYDEGEKLKFKIDKGAIFMFPTNSMHHDFAYYSDLERFDPERFSD